MFAPTVPPAPRSAHGLLIAAHDRLAAAAASRPTTGTADQGDGGWDRC